MLKVDQLTWSEIPTTVVYREMVAIDTEGVAKFTEEVGMDTLVAMGTQLPDLSCELNT